MAENSAGDDSLERQNDHLRQQNARLQSALDEIRARLTEPEQVIRAIRQGEIDALVVEGEGEEQIYALQRFDSVYRTMVEESLPYGVWLAEADGKLLYASRSFLDLAKTDLREMREKGQFHFLPPETRERVESEWGECRGAGGPCDAEYEVGAGDGSGRVIWTHGVLATQDGVPYWGGVNIDVTERSKARRELRRQSEALREADRRKDEFLAMLAHELRNPLAPILTAVDRLRLKLPQDSDLTPILGVVERQAGQMTRLVDDLLDVSRITQGKIALRKERTDLRAVVATAIETARPHIDARRHDLEYSPPHEPLPMEADPARLTQALSNVLCNAAKYTDKGGRIRLTAVRDGGEAVVRVRDTGVGIAPEMLPRIFDLFVQADHSVGRSQGGLGIGLTVARRLVEMHGGSLTASSEGAGRGSEFSIRLPFLVESAVAGGGRGGVGIPTPEVARRILLVDDLVEAVEEMAALLREAFGHDVRTAHDGPTAVRAAAEFRPELVLLDIGLPGMSGHEVARRLRELPGLGGAVLVALTGWGQEEDRRRTREAGFDHHLVKPVGLKELRPLLASLR